MAAQLRIAAVLLRNTGRRRAPFAGWRTKTVIVPKYKIGDRFLFKNLCYGISKQGKTALSQTFTNVIGEIEKYTYIKPDRIFYTIHLEEGKFTLLLNEEYLSTLDMVVSQGVMK